MGRDLIAALLRRGHGVRALARRQSVQHIPAGAETVVGNALEPGTFADKVAPADTLVQPRRHPASQSGQGGELPGGGPALGRCRARGGARGAHRAFRLRQRGAARSGDAGLHRCAPGGRGAHPRQRHPGDHPASVVRARSRAPLAHLLVPFHALAALVPPLHETALRLGLVTIGQMVGALVASIERGSQGVRILDVPAIRAADAAGLYSGDQARAQWKH